MSNVITPPKEYPQPTLIAYSFECFVDSVILGTSAVVRVLLKNSSEETFRVEYLNLEGDAYKAWGADDDYIVKWTREQLGLPPLA